MKKIIILLLLLTSFVFANSKNLIYHKKDLEVLEQLDIEKEFIKDRKLRRIFEKYTKKTRLAGFGRDIRKAEPYLGKIISLIDDAKLPKELVYLPMAESNFKIKVRSNSNAVGIWQFIPQTAKLYGLHNNYLIDERLDIVKSSKAGLRYLKRHHDKFGKWYLSILAYNCGLGRVTEAVTRLKLDAYLKKHPNLKKERKFKNYVKIVRKYTGTKRSYSKMYKIFKESKKWDVEVDINKLLGYNKKLRRQYLPRESKIYLRKIIAFSFLGNRNFYSKTIDFDKMKDRIVVVKAKPKMHLRTIAKALKTSSSTFLRMNAHFKKAIVPNNKRYRTLYIPLNKKVAYNNYIKRVERRLASGKAAFKKYHVVKRGDTLYKISRIYKVAYKDIIKLNNLKSNLIAINQILVIPTRNV